MARLRAVFPPGDLAHAEAYASRVLQRYDRRLLRVRALQDQTMRTAFSIHPAQVMARNYVRERLEQLAQRIITRRDKDLVRFMYVLEPQSYR